MRQRTSLIVGFGLLIQGCSSQPPVAVAEPQTAVPTSAKQAFWSESGANSKGLMVVTPSASESKQKTAANASTVAASHYQGLTYWIERSKGGAFQRVTASTEFHQGDRIRFKLRANRSGYLYVVTRGVSGRTAYLFPTKASESEFIVAGQEYVIPKNDLIVFDHQAGTEEVWLFLSDKPLSADTDQASVASTSTIAANSCATKDLVLSSPDSAQSQCGPLKSGGNSKDILVEDDAQSNEPGGYSVMNAEQFDKGALLSLKLQLRHK